MHTPPPPDFFLGSTTDRNRSQIRWDFRDRTKPTFNQISSPHFFSGKKMEWCFYCFYFSEKKKMQKKIRIPSRAKKKPSTQKPVAHNFPKYKLRCKNRWLQLLSVEQKLQLSFLIDKAVKSSFPHEI